MFELAYMYMNMRNGMYVLVCLFNIIIPRKAAATRRSRTHTPRHDRGALRHGRARAAVSAEAAGRGAPRRRRYRCSAYARVRRGAAAVGRRGRLRAFMSKKAY